ncbi:hypothetical protein COW46_02605 [Candidatus Gracilibacteria bacterium CG17_big_fil_post_rev_8_21_14_2_50_48_13]|nr:MAG: hypothetical protein COW46_02605 [Candidatus Gracilibacteria bacterium CG17_big_fil_post_rev_8_21_14_2_50_48_13]
MANAAQTPNKAPEAPISQVELEISQAELLKAKTEFLKFPEAQKKKEVVMKLLSPLLANGYLLSTSEKGYVLHMRPAASSAKEESQKTDAEKKEERKIIDTAKAVSEALQAMQDAKTPGQTIAKTQGKDAYVLKDVFTDAFTDILESKTFIDGQLLALGAQKDEKLSNESLMKKAENKELGSLGALLLATKGATGADALQRDKAIYAIVNAVHDLPQKNAFVESAKNTADGGWQWLKEGWENIKYGAQLPGFVGEGVKNLVTGIEQNGIMSTVNTIPKQLSVLGLLGAFFIPKGQNWHSPLSLFRYAMIGLAGGSLANQQMYNGGSFWQKGAGFLREMFGLPPAESKPDTSNSSAPNTPESKEIPAKIPDAMIQVLREQGLTDNDINLVHRYSTAPTSAVLSTMMPELPNSAGGRWDISISPSLGTLFSPEQKSYLEKSKIDLKSMEQGYYRTLELIGRKWKQDMIETMPDGNAFLQERSDAYRGWLVMKRVFSTDSQERVNNNVKDLVGPNQSFATAAYLLLETSDKTTGQNPTLDRMKSAVKEIRRVYREESLQADKKNTWDTYADATEKTKKSPSSPAAQQPDSKKSAPDKKSVTESLQNEIDQRQMPSKSERLAEIEGAGVYTDVDFEQIPTAAAQVREYIRNQKMKLISLLQSGMANLRVSERPKTPTNQRAEYYRTSGADLMNRAKGLIQQIRLDTKKYAPTADAEKVVRTVLLDVYRSDKMEGFEEALEELFVSAKVQGIPPLFREKTS